MATIYSSACPLNCWDSCGFHVTVESGKIVKVEGDPTHPITKGKICGRGKMLETRTNSPDRLLFPLKKVNGEFMQITWEQALSEIAEKMTMVKDTFGSTSILHSHDYANNGLLKNVDQRFFNCFGGVTELIGSLCWGSGIEAQKIDFGNAISHAPDDIFNSKNIVIWGRNASRTNLHFFQHVQEAKKRGIHIFVIDPIYNATAKIATKHITIKPGMDGILAVGIMKEMKRLELYDSLFIENHTTGYQDLSELLESITLEEVSEQSEVSIETITMLASIYGNGPTSTFMGLGMQRYQNGGNTIRLLDALVAVSGNVGVKGGGANYANLQVGQSFNWEPLTLPHKKQSERKFTIMKQAEEIIKANDPPIKMIVVTCGNPLLQVPNSHIVQQAFSSVDTLVVLEQFMTDTAKLADYVLPVATVFEEEDLYYSSMYHHYVQYGPKIVEPPGEAKPDLWIWTELANRLGFGNEFAYSRDDYFKMALTNLENSRITIEKWKEEKFIELPIVPIPWSDHQFQTPSGKYEFTSTLDKEKGKLTLSLPRESIWSDPERVEQFPYHLLTIHPLRSNHSQNYHLIKELGKVKVEVSIDIAKEKGLDEKDIVRVWNDRGEVKGYVQYLKKAHPKTINIDEGIWESFGGSVNRLTSSEESDLKLGSTLYDCVVNIEKWKE